MPDSFLQTAVFTRWVDPVTGVASYILAARPEQRVAPVQQSFYYVNPSLGADGRHYWFYCAFPPAGEAGARRCLGAVDFSRQTLRVFPETLFTEASPMLDAQTGEIYWANDSGIWKRGAEGDAQLVNRFPPGLVRNRRVARYATHLSLSADRRALNIDGRIGGDCVLGQAPLDGSEIEIWQTLPPNLNHGQSHPRDPGLMLVAQDYSADPISGVVQAYKNRLWLIRRGGKIEAVYPEAAQAGPARTVVAMNPHLANPSDQANTVSDPRALHGHEWWSADGGYIWYIHYQTGVERVSLATACTPAARPELVWPHSTVSHAHANATDDLLVLDSLPPEDPSDRRVTFVNLKTRRAVNIVSFMPEPAPELKRYHVHPHPQFCGGDEVICYTTTVLGRVDVAFTRVADLVAATQR